MTCDFCDNPDIQQRAIIKNDLAWAFPTRTPIVPGHILIAPIRHAETEELLLAEELEAIFTLIHELKPVLRKIFGAEGFNFAWNEGSVAGQSVPHLHLHLLPRKPGDTGITTYEPRKFLYRPGSREASPESEVMAITQTLKEALYETARDQG